MAHSYTNLLYHIVFATKERRPWLDQPLRNGICAVMGEVVAAEGGILELGIFPEFRSISVRDNAILISTDRAIHGWHRKD